MSWLFDKFAEWWLSRCTHPDDDVAADILEGAISGYEVRWCRRCGAHKFNEGGWRRPRPMWCEPYNSVAMRRDRDANG